MARNLMATEARTTHLVMGSPLRLVPRCGQQHPDQRPPVIAIRARLVLCLLFVMGGAAVHAQSAPEDGSNPPALAADLSETVVRPLVTVQPLHDEAHSGDMVLTHYRPPGDGSFPAVVMQHGRGSNQRANPARYRSSDVARYWLRRGVTERRLIHLLQFTETGNQ
jgi:hypothetical protein